LECDQFSVVGEGLCLDVRLLEFLGRPGNVIAVHVADRNHVLLDRVHVPPALPADADATDANSLRRFLLRKQRSAIRGGRECREHTGRGHEERAAGAASHGKPPEVGWERAGVCCRTGGGRRQHSSCPPLCRWYSPGPASLSDPDMMRLRTSLV